MATSGSGIKGVDASRMNRSDALVGSPEAQIKDVMTATNIIQRNTVILDE
jgi:hypothetical protein